MSEFNLFGPATKDQIRVAYISTERGLVDNVTICEANSYAQLNPGTQFIFSTREFTKYMNINGVNKLTPDDLAPAIQCEGVEMTKECGPPQALFSGGDGIGIKGNPIIGQDGSVMAIDLVAGGFGFQSPPHVEVKDNCGIGAGGNFRAELGDIAETEEVYDLEEDFEEYEICDEISDITAAGDVYGRRYGVNGEDLGVWEPKLYANFDQDPLRREIQKYQDILQKGTNPFWTTRKESPLSVTGEMGTKRRVYKVDAPRAWGDFMNKNAVSPKPASNVPGSDFAGVPYTMVWEEEFPYDGEYVFRAQCDNKAELYFDNLPLSNFKIGFGGAAGHTLSAPEVLKKTIKAGVHQIRIDLLNLPIMETVIEQEPVAIDESTTKTVVYVGLHGANKPIKVTSDKKGIELKDGHGNDTNCSLRIKSGDLKFSDDGKSLIGPGSATIEMNWSDNPGTAGVAVEKITVAGQTWTQSGRSGTETHLVTIDPPPKPVVKSTESQEMEIHKVFNTIDYIDKANRPLWRTNIYNKGGFINEYGICPFDTTVTLDDNPYAGTHTITWNNIKFPIDGNYDITVGVDDNVTLHIEDITRGTKETIKKIGFAGASNTSTGKSNYIKNFLKGTYTITAELEQIPGGRFGFKSGVPAGFSKITYNGLHPANTTIRVRDAGKKIELKDGHGNDANATLQVTSGDALFSADGQKLEGSGEATIVLSWNDRRTAGRAIDSIRIGSTTFKRSGSSGNVSHTVVIGGDVKGINPMVLAVNIETAFTAKQVISAKSWNENPMGIALTIDAPDPPIPQEQIPEAPGRCPRNPMWSTRHPNADKKWYPVRIEGWSQFLNRYAMSPVAPRSDVSSDAGGTVFTNTWQQEIPYSGWYKLRAEVDDICRIYINGEKQIDLSRRIDKIRGEKKFFLAQGETEIKVEVENYDTRVYETIDKKIFSTADWAVTKKQTITGPKNVDVTFKTSSASLYANSITLFDGSLLSAPLFSDSKEYDGPQIKNTHTHNIEVGKVYDVRLTSSNKKTVTGASGIQFSGLHSANNPIEVTNNGKRLCLKDGDGNDCNASFTIDSGDVKFSTDGKSLVGSGSVKFTLSWNDNPRTAGVAIERIKIGTTTWTRNGRSGTETHTVQVGASSTGGSNNSNIQLRNKGKNVIQMEDWTDNDWADIICSATEGEFYDLQGRTCKFRVPPKNIKTSGSTAGGTAKDGVTYNGPELSTYTSGDLGAALTPKWDFTGDAAIDDQHYRDNHMDKTWTSTWSSVEFPEDGQYQIQCTVDDTLSVKIDGVEVANAKILENVPGSGAFNEAEYLKYGKTNVKTITFNTIKGKRTVSATYTNIPGNQGSTFYTNPVHFSFKITRKVSIGSGSSKSWTDNPIGISAILIPPPCPKKVSGKGTVTKVIVDDPGNGFPKPSGDGYPVGLGLSAINIKDCGINYDCSKDRLVIEPSNGASARLVCDNFGRIADVIVDDPGLGFTKWPDIRIERDPGVRPPDDQPTGVNFEATPVFEIIRDPIVVNKDKLLQVTDLVGVKQTGYYEGRPYYGAVFYKDNIRYAGWYETVGELVQIYDTLQESIDAQVTTPQSAILRQGSDSSSNDPKLNIPGTPENLT